ncbi:hypothetical protein TraAM80_04595 [Trypanosoma rangeli]|uniref:Uncharacterized protein n=1 Tax=Trypanosoma rangeli TaxID=5698 RepID=A0A422NIT2_TRYRA|nr:uncharacterized protein TraAM80_04595 [Trypanosoma rangeli]RNF05304.1 hypothetical protein TraAM80_04595 [Trypanosoma rangeli]|eukprot:RNF05304.1 hypothetical protein TraAM80_04595 [Trypanosoma rangeli]
MTNSREGLRTLQGRLEYVERREKEREQDLYEQLRDLQLELSQVRDDFGAAETACRQEMSRLRQEWQTTTVAAAEAQKKAEAIWRDLVADERERLVTEHRQRERERFDALHRVVGTLAEALAGLSDTVSVISTGNSELSAQVEQELKQHRSWLERHKGEEAGFLKLFKETCTQLQDALCSERRAREESMNRIEELLTRRDDGAATAPASKIHRF